MPLCGIHVVTRVSVEILQLVLYSRRSLAFPLFISLSDEWTYPVCRQFFRQKELKCDLRVRRNNTLGRSRYLQ